MVYESDFYTTRRPYTRPSTYSTTMAAAPGMRFIPYVGKVRTVSSLYPTSGSYVSGHRRLVMSRSAPHSVITIRVRPAVVIRELDRIEHRPRPNYAYSPSEEFLCSNAAKDWQDETRNIRAQTAALLQRINSTVPRASSVVPYSTISRYEPPARFSCDNYLMRMIEPVRNVMRDITNMSWYAEPAKRFTGRGHLSCLRYTGNKTFPYRKALCQDSSVRDDVNLLSYYAKNRLAANGLALDSVTVKLMPYRPTRKFQPPALMEDPSKELKEAKAERLSRFMATEPSAAKVDPAENDRAAERRKKRQEEEKQAAEKAAAEELAAKKKEQAARDEAVRSAELARQEQLAAQAAAERAAELEKKAEASRLAEEKAAAEAAAAAEKAQLAEEAKRLEEERLAAEEEQRQKEMSRLAEIEKQAAEEKEAELARQAGELAELARQEAELAAQAKQEAELAELAKQEAELAELAKQEAELAELAKQEAELAELAKQEAELAELAKQEAELAELAKQEAEINTAAEESTAEPTVEEPASPDVQKEEEAIVNEDEASERQDAEGEVTEEEEEEEEE